MSAVTFVGCRFLLSALALAPFAFYEAKKQITPLHIKDIALACSIGICLFIRASLQQLGLETTTATNGGFLTAIYVVITPFFVWMLTRERPRSIVLVACVVSIIGAWLMANKGHAQTWMSGDALLLIADIAWAAAMALIPIFLKRCDRPLLLSFVQYTVTAVLGFGFGLSFEPMIIQGIKNAIPAILYAGLMSGAVAFTLQIIAQKYTPPAETALIGSLESVFAAFAGILLLQERLTFQDLLGCALILLSVIMVEAGPLFGRAVKWRTTRRT